MQNVKKWLLAACVVAALGGAAMVMDVAFSPAVEAQEGMRGDHWHNHNGHWWYWHAGDRRWYYNDGAHWFYHTGKGGWNLYRFDGQFGRTNFHRGDYRLPPENSRVDPRWHGPHGPR